ncbi:MAG TPA: glycosyltransferase family 4 protein [Candidatus Paceibacterota bacterium]
MTKSIVVTGYPYAYSYYFKVFEYAENKDDLVFILPKRWEAKNGKVKIDFKKRGDFKIYSLSAWSYGGRALFSGLFKGWMPSTCFILPLLRLKYNSRVLYSCLEPNLLGTLYNGFFAKLFGYKHVLFTWQNVPPERRMSGLKLKLSNALVRANLFFADGIICGNKKAADIVRKWKMENEDWKILICPLSGVDTEKFKPSQIVQDKLNWLLGISVGNLKYILFYGALEKRKGVDQVIEAMKRLKEIRNDIKFELDIIGTGPEEEGLKKQKKENGLSDNVVFLDWTSNDKLPNQLDKADVFVYPSIPLDGWEEQFGYAMAEASSCEVPVVATRTGSIEEVIIDGKSGILVEPNNPEQLAEAINKILSDKELAERMGRFGREYVIKNYSHPVIAKKLVLFLKQF